MPEKIYWFQTKSTGQNFEILWSDLSDLLHVCRIDFHHMFKQEKTVLYGAALFAKVFSTKIYLIMIRERFSHSK